MDGRGVRRPDTMASPPTAPRASPPRARRDGSSWRAWSRASCSACSSGGSRPSSASTETSSTLPAASRLGGWRARGASTVRRRIALAAPPRARVERVMVDQLDRPFPSPGSGFVIEESVAAASADRLFPPEIATCDDCVREPWDPADRRHRYPFINCTNCGPRASIIEDLPYDRARTSMREFPLCADCEREYRDPATAASTRNPWRARPAAHPSRTGHRVRPRPRHARRTPWQRPSQTCSRGGSWRSRGSGATTSAATRRTPPPWPVCATASAGGPSRSRSWSATSTRPARSPSSARPRRTCSRRRCAPSSWSRSGPAHRSIPA